MNAPDLGGRKHKLAWGWVIGHLLGIVIGLAVAAVWYPAAPADWVIGVSLGLGGFFGSFGGLGLGLLLTAVPDARRRMARSASYGALVGGTLGCVVAALCYLDLWHRAIPLHDKIIQLISFPAVFTPAGMIVGLLVGSSDVERDTFLRHLDAERAAVEAAIERRFGPLDEVRRAMIQTWDADRLTEARRKLDDARSVEELDA